VLDEIGASEPELLFLDEPVSSLDPAGRHEALELLATLGGRVTVFMSTHVLADMERVCDWVGIIDRGRLVVESTAVDLQSRFSQPVFVIELEPGRGADDVGLVAALERVPVVGGTSRHGAEILRVVATSGSQVARSSASGPASRTSSCGSCQACGPR
jgi:ABC-type multidrug transport system ATPase subunit